MREIAHWQARSERLGEPQKQILDEFWLGIAGINPLCEMGQEDHAIFLPGTTGVDKMPMRLEDANSAVNSAKRNILPQLFQKTARHFCHLMVFQAPSVILKNYD